MKGSRTMVLILARWATVSRGKWDAAGFSGVVVDDAAGVVDCVGVACGEGEHLVGAVYVPVAAKGGEGVFGVPVEFVDEFDACTDVFVFAPRLGEADAGEEGSEFCAEEDVGGFEEDASFDACDGVGDDVAFAADDGPECVEEGVVSAGFDLDEDVGEFGGFGFADVDDDDGTVVSAFGTECAGGVGGVAGEVAGVGGDGVAAPVDDDVGTVFDLAEGAAGVADFLDCHDGGAVAFGGAVVHDGADFFGDFKADVHGFGGGAGPAVEEREERRQPFTTSVIVPSLMWSSMSSQRQPQRGHAWFLMIFSPGSVPGSLVPWGISYLRPPRSSMRSQAVLRGRVVGVTSTGIPLKSGAPVEWVCS